MTKIFVIIDQVDQTQNNNLQRKNNWLFKFWLAGKDRAPGPRRFLPNRFRFGRLLFFARPQNIVLAIFSGDELIIN